MQIENWKVFCFFGFFSPQWVTYWFPNEHLYLMVNFCHLGQNLLLDNFVGLSVFFYKHFSTFLAFFYLSRFLQLLFPAKHLTFYHRTLNYHTSHPHKHSPFTFLLRIFVSTKLITLGKPFHISTDQRQEFCIFLITDYK